MKRKWIVKLIQVAAGAGVYAAARILVEVPPLRRFLEENIYGTPRAIPFILGLTVALVAIIYPLLKWIERRLA